MAEYIEREAVLNKQIGVVVYDEGGWDANVRAVPAEDIEAIPAADVAHVVHGRWIDRTKNISGYYDYRTDCSVCEHIFWFGGVQSFSYCPNCGAKMDLEVRDNA